LLEKTRFFGAERLRMTELAIALGIARAIAFFQGGSQCHSEERFCDEESRSS
jgi:hypothetical protein